MIDVPKLLADLDRLVEKLPDWKPNVLRRRYLVGKLYRNRPHTCNNMGDRGRSKRRVPGWRKHGKTSANVPW